MLRAIGYQPEMIALSFVLEASFIALVGIGLGVGAGILLGQAIIGQLFSVITAGRTLAVPWRARSGSSSWPRTSSRC